MSPGTARDPALDFVKGFLILAMLASHVRNLAILDDHLQRSLQSYTLDFVSGSWIFISDVIIASLYRKRFAVDWYYCSCSERSHSVVHLTNAMVKFSGEGSSERILDFGASRKFFLWSSWTVLTVSIIFFESLLPFETEGRANGLL